MTKERPGEREAVARDLEWCRQAALVARRGPVSFAEFTRALATATRALESLAPAQSAKDAAYSERNRMVAFLSRLYPSSLERHPESEPWEDDWRWIVFVDLPTGQATWHIHDSELAEFAHLPRETGRKWDGHDTEEKYRRLATLSARAGTEGGDGTLPQYVEEAIKAHIAAASTCGATAWTGGDDECERASEEYVKTGAALRVAILRYAAPTRAREDALEEMAEALLDELDDFLPLVDDLDCGQPVNGEEFTACELATKQRATELRRALSPADGGGRG